MITLDELPNAKHWQPWNTRPKGPYHFLRSPNIYELNIKSLADAVELFARQAMPAHDTFAHIMNDHGVLILGYIDLSGPALDWFGIKKGFDLLRKQPYMEQLEIELAEMMAKDRADGLIVNTE